jgi:hypothetical protein
MRAYGTDRVRHGKDDQWILTSPRSKHWFPRVPKTLTTAEFPGTAVLWEERFFEVVTAENSDPSGVRYVLAPWRDEHIIRVSESYDEASEARRETEYHAAVAREKGRKASNLFGLFIGHLPSAIQEHLGSDIGILPTKLTALSLILPLIYLVWCANEFVRHVMDASLSPMNPLFLMIAVYLLIESTIRLNVVWLQGRAIGSVAGWIAYLLYYVIAGKWSGALSPFTVPRGQRLYYTKPEENVALQDAFRLREPLVTLLSTPEQAALAQRFGYDYRSQSFIVAFVLLVFALAGIVTSIVKLNHGPRISVVVSLVAAGFVALEQVVRLASLRRGPAGSVLAVVVRPFLRKLLI